MFGSNTQLTVVGRGNGLLELHHVEVGRKPKEGRSTEKGLRRVCILL